MKIKNLFFLLLNLLALNIVSAQTFQDKAKAITKSKSDSNEKIQLPIKLTPTETSNDLNTQTSPLNNFQSLNFDRNLQAQGLKVVLEQNGLPRFVTGSLNTSSATNATPTQKCYEYISVLQQSMKIADPSEFKIFNTDADELGFEHYKMQQTYKNLPVYGGQIILHSKSGKITAMNGAYFPTPQIDNITPSLSSSDAENIIIADFKSKSIYKPLSDDVLKQIGGSAFKSELVVYHVKNNFEAEKLTWHVVAYSSAVHRFDYFIDAQTGKILNQIETSCTLISEELKIKSEKFNSENVNSSLLTYNSSFFPPLDGAVSIGAKDLLGVTRTINTYLSGGTYFMIDASRTGMFKPSQSTFPDKPVGVIQTIDNKNTDDGPASYVTSNNNSNWSPTSVSAQYNAGVTYLYYLNTFGRNSINGKGGNINSFINVTDQGVGMDNAYWNGEAMYYGNGNKYFYPLAEGLDVAGHEISHGVIQNTANLEYQDESGALNESYADVFGSLIDRDNWTIGETVIKDKNTFNTGFLRDLSNPHNGGSKVGQGGYQPAIVSEMYLGSQDNGGVHINSGVPNFAYYKFASDANVGKVIAEQVYYRAITKYLVKSSNFKDMRAAIEASVKDLYAGNAAVLTAAQNAFTAVGIGTGGSSDGSAYQKDLPTNTGAEYLLYVGANKTGIFIRPAAGGASTQISSSVIQSKPSISDGGTDIIFVSSDKNVQYINIDWKTGKVAAQQALTTSGAWHNAVISRDGNRFAGNKGDTLLYIVDFVSNTQKVFGLSNPTTASGSISNNYVQYSDALEFDPLGEFLVYDAYNKENITGSSTGQDYWDVGLINVWSNKSKAFGTGKIFKLFTQLDVDESIGNPTFAKNSPYILALDDAKNYSTNPTYSVVSANIQTGDVTQTNTGIFTNNTLSYPNFSKNDNNILANNYDNSNQLRLINIPVTASRLEPNGNPIIVQSSTAQFGSWFANGIRNTPTVEVNANTKVSVNPNPFNNTLTISIDGKIDNGDVALQVIDLAGRVVLTQNYKTYIGNNTFSLNTQSLGSGIYFAQFNVSNMPVTIKVVKL